MCRRNFHAMRELASLLVLGLLMALFRRVTGAGPLEARATLALGFLVLAAHVGGALAARARLPRLTGYLLTGLAVGPSWARLVRPDELRALAFIGDAALALIAFAAGSRLKIDALRVARRPLARVTAEADELLALAQKEREQATDLWQFTSLIKENYSRGQKVVLLEIMWGLVYADGQLASHEEYLMRKICNLLDLEPGYLGEVKKRLGTKIEYGVHIHNDFGMATALNLAALEEGVQCVNTTLGGLGERAGNTPFEEVVLALELLYDHDTGIDLERIQEVSAKVEEYSGVPLGITKPITGYNAFTHESGIHTDGVIKNTLTYEPIQVEMMRGRTRRFVFGKHTGTRAIETRLAEYGLTNVPKEILIRLQREIKLHTEHKLKSEQGNFIATYRDWDENHKGVTPREFWDLARKAGIPTPDRARKETTARAR